VFVLYVIVLSILKKWGQKIVLKIIIHSAFDHIHSSLQYITILYN